MLYNEKNKDVLRSVEIIKNFYKDKRSNRTNQLYMRHIYEGLFILNRCKCDEFAKQAFTLHPLAQNDEDLLVNMQQITKMNSEIIILLMEYRKTANQYLTNMQIKNKDQIYLSPIKEVNQMLYADKIQNYKDAYYFYPKDDLRYHYLILYFNSWLDFFKDKFYNNLFIEAQDYVFYNFTSTDLDRHLFV